MCVYNALDYGTCAGKYECDFAMGISGVRYSEISELLRLAEKAMPTLEKRRSTVAEVAGQPKYCRAITSRLGICSWCSSQGKGPRGVATFIPYGLTFIECLFKPLNVFRV